jgi:hypothetical protein
MARAMEIARLAPRQRDYLGAFRAKGRNAALPTSPVAPATTTFFTIVHLSAFGPADHATAVPHAKTKKPRRGLRGFGCRPQFDQFWLSPMIGKSLS